MLALLSAGHAVALLAVARGATALFAFLRFGLSSFMITFTVQTLVLAAAAVAIARGGPGRDRRALAAALGGVAVLQCFPLAISLSRGGSFLTLGDALFVGGLLGAAWAALHASRRERAAAPAPEVAAHLAVAAVGPLVWTVTNATMGRLDFTLSSAIALAGTAALAWAFAARRADAAPPSTEAAA